jgi:hypothetical protein
VKSGISPGESSPSQGHQYHLTVDHYMVTSISSEQEQSRSKKRYVNQIKLVP